MNNSSLHHQKYYNNPPKVSTKPTNHQHLHPTKQPKHSIIIKPKVKTKQKQTHKTKTKHQLTDNQTYSKQNNQPLHQPT